MAINWYPGHMHKARKDISEIMPQVDVIIELIDARIPFSSENPLVPQLRGDKPCIKVLNKADLADPAITERWVTHLELEKGITALPLTQKNQDQIKQLLPMCNELLPDRNLDIKGARALILGVPNVGKSTLINTLAGRQIARTGNIAGVTIAQQRIRLEHGVVLTDTPGFLWPKLNPPTCGYRLAITGAIKDTVYDYADIAMFAADYMLQAYPDVLKSRYGLTELPETEIEFLEAIGAKRGCMRKGGHVDLNKIAEIFVVELRSGVLGPLSLETPEMTYAELEQAKLDEAQKEQDKAERDKLRRDKAKKRYR